MKYDEKWESFTLKSGKEFDGSFGIIGMKIDGNEISGGFDNYVGSKQDFTEEERKEIAEYMIELWNECAKGT